MPKMPPQLLAVPEINLLHRFRSRLLIHAKRLYVIQAFCMSLIGIFVLMLLGVFSYQGYLYLQIQKKQETIDSEKQQIESLSALETKYLILKKKLSAILTIAQDAQHHQAQVEGVLELLPPEILVSGVQIEDTGEIVFTAQTQDPKVLAQFIDNISDYKQHPFGSVESAQVKGVVINPKGEYAVNVAIKLAL